MADGGFFQDADEQPQDDGQTQTGMHPALDAFQNAFTTPESHEWALKAGADIQDFLNKRQAIDNVQAAGDAFVNNLAGFKDNLTGMVRDDPSTSDLAMKLVPDAIGGMLAGHDDTGEHAQTLTDHLQSEIAKTAVQSWAKLSPDMAKVALKQYDNHFDDDERTLLNAHIGVMDVARQADMEADARRVAQQRVDATDTHAMNYMRVLQAPDGSFAPPPNWMKEMAGDPAVPSSHSKALWDAYGRLTIYGDQPSDAGYLTDMVGRLGRGDAGPMDLIHSVPQGVSLKDATWLAGLPKQQLQGLDQTLQAARRQIAPIGDAPEAAAYQRFVPWLVDNLRAGASLNPQDQNWVLGASDDASSAFWNWFKPRGDDIVQGQMPPGTGPRAVSPDRPSLGDIFGKRTGPRPSFRMPIGPVPGVATDGRAASRGGFPDYEGQSGYAYQDESHLMGNNRSRDEFGEPRDAGMEIQPTGRGDLEIAIQPSGAGPGAMGAPRRPPRGRAR